VCSETDSDQVRAKHLPKGTNLRAYDALDLAAIESKLNSRPRKTLAWRTPAEVFGLAT
jgi:transposase, IS30 family